MSDFDDDSDYGEGAEGEEDDGLDVPTVGGKRSAGTSSEHDAPCDASDAWLLV
jgi:hypothetical protein